MIPVYSEPEDIAVKVRNMISCIESGEIRPGLRVGVENNQLLRYLGYKGYLKVDRVRYFLITKLNELDEKLTTK